MAVNVTFLICAAALLIQIISGVYIDSSCDRVAPWARTFLAWREANTNIAGSFTRPIKTPGASRYPAARVPNSAYSPSALSNIPSLSNNGDLIVTSVSKGPIGVSLLSNNFIEGPLSVAGKLPFLGTVALEGTLPTSGSGAVSYGSDSRLSPIITKEFSRPGCRY